jgi:hypothetical protein
VVGVSLVAGGVAVSLLALVVRALAAVIASTADIRRACDAVVVCTNSVIRACQEVEPLARDIRLDVEATRESVKTPLTATSDALRKASDDLTSLKTTLLVTLASVIAAASAFLAL